MIIHLVLSIWLARTILCYRKIRMKEARYKDISEIEGAVRADGANFEQINEFINIFLVFLS